MLNNNRTILFKNLRLIETKHWNWMFVWAKKENNWNESNFPVYNLHEPSQKDARGEFCSKPRGTISDQVHSDQMVLGTVRWRWEMKLLIRKMMMRGEPVGHKRQRHCVLRNCTSALSILYIALPTYQKGQIWGGGNRGVNRTHSEVPAGFLSHLSAGHQYGLQGFWWEQVFLYSTIIPSKANIQNRIHTYLCIPLCAYFYILLRTISGKSFHQIIISYGFIQQHERMNPQK